MKRFILVPVVLTLTVVAVMAAAAATTVKISGSTTNAENDPGEWYFNRDASTSTPYEFNDDEASIGVGSLYVLPIGENPSDKFIGEYFLFSPIADVESISYDFKIGSSGDASDSEQFYLNIYANFGVSADVKFYDCRYEVIPATGSLDEFTTVTFDPNASYPVTTRGGASASPYPCPSTPADMDDFSAGSNIRAIVLNVGDTSPSLSDAGLDGYLDNVVVDLVSGLTVFDFDPPPTTPANADGCKTNGWSSLMRDDYTSFKNQGDCIQYLNTGK